MENTQENDDFDAKMDLQSFSDQEQEDEYDEISALVLCSFPLHKDGNIIIKKWRNGFLLTPKVGFSQNWNLLNTFQPFNAHSTQEINALNIEIKDETQNGKRKKEEETLHDVCPILSSFSFQENDAMHITNCIRHHMVEDLEHEKGDFME